MSYCMYLRKSRVDLEAEAHGEGETLARHESRLIELARKLSLSITEIKKEIVSGETLAARPVMQQLLSEVEAGMWQGVLVVEVERLARGETIDQGIVAQAFKYSGTKIITPAKTYDPENEFDESFFEFGLFMSRQEYRTINRRLQAGRLQSVKEGKWTASAVPDGYLRVKIKGEKGYTLAPDPARAEIVKTIFQKYGVDRLGSQEIANYLNGQGLTTATGLVWDARAVLDHLRNPAYAGRLVYGRRRTEKTVQNGVIVRSNPRHADFQVFPGRHPPLVDAELFDRVQSLIGSTSQAHPRRHKYLVNPLVCILYCSECGARMQLRPYVDQNYYVCQYRGCTQVCSRASVVESLLLETLRKYLVSYRVPVGQNTDDTARIAEISNAIAAAQKQLEKIAAQRAKSYDLVEQGIYTTSEFVERQRQLSERETALNASIVESSAELAQLKEMQAARSSIVPHMEQVIEAYTRAETAQEKNDLLRSILSKIVYKKTTRERSLTGSDLTLTIFPLFPSAPH